MERLWESVEEIGGIGLILLGVGTVFSAIACILSGVLLMKHFRNYRQPNQQRCIVRIIAMVPIYAIYSVLALAFPDQQVYIGFFRDAYEAYALYMFYALCVEYIGGEKRMVEVLRSQPKTRLLLPCWCWVQPGESFLRWNKRGILQYALLRPAVSIVCAILMAFGHFEEGEWDWHTGFPYATIVNNLGVTVSLYCLALFYKVASDELKPYHPVIKFFAIKMIVFFCYWQSILISILIAMAWVPSVGGWTEGEVAMNAQNFLICFEMLCFAILHLYAFPATRYMMQAQSQMPLVHDVKVKVNALHALGDSVQQTDVVKDAVDSFVPTVAQAVNTIKKPEKITLEKDVDDMVPLDTHGEDVSILKHQQDAPIQDLGLRRNYEDDVHNDEQEALSRDKERDDLPEDIATLTAVASKN